MRKNLRTISRAERGFTLTEIAIVLGIIGLILGAIWAAASAVYSNMKNSQGEQGVLAASQAVRSMYAASNNTGATTVGQVLTVAGMFPVSWATTGTANSLYGNPWVPANSLSSGDNTSFIVGDSTNLSAFGIELDQISAAGCAALANYFSSAAAGSNGGQITGLVGTKITATDTTALTTASSMGGSGEQKNNWASAGTCSSKLGGPYGANYQNGIIIWFDMNQM